MIFRMGTETASSLPISMRYPYAAIPIGGMALIVHSLDHMMANAARRVNDRHEVSKEQQWER
jgi:TRAP-type C4-dicarboxylate transport system permease small subunit